MTKYKNKRVTVNGIAFDSVKEAKRYQELLLLERTGAITNLRRQVKFILIPHQKETVVRYSEKTGKRLQDDCRVIERECSYIADFVYIENGKKVVEDTKGFRTPEYRIKKKLMLWVHGIRIKEV